MTVDCCDVGQTQLTIDTLPDDVLLCAFDFFVAQGFGVEAWHTLVHVCRRWRILVFQSPCRLNLQISCTNQTPVKEKLDVWPALPIVISGTSFSPADTNNIKTALKHHNRVCQIQLFTLGELEFIIAPLEEPFPILTDLELVSSLQFSSPFNPNPSKFLGGSAHLRSLTLRRIPIPDLLNLLLCTPNLVTLRLDQIPNSFLPDEMVTVLSSLTRLETLELSIEFDRSHPELENRHLPLLTRTILPSLTMFWITGHAENMEDFITRINAPSLDHLYLSFPFSVFNQVIVIDTRHLQFIGCLPKLQAPDGAHIAFDADNSKIWIKFFFSTQISRRVVTLEIFSIEPERQLPCLVQFCRSPPFPLHSLEYLCISEGQFPQERQRNHTENTQWLEFLRQFAAVKKLHLTNEFALRIAHALQELVGGRVMEVLPTLENVFIHEFGPSKPVHEVIKEFDAARRLTGHPIIISRRDLLIR